MHVPITFFSFFAYASGEAESLGIATSDDLSLPEIKPRLFNTQLH
jgi:hypothetical protein